jgi:hypothetical protein
MQPISQPRPLNKMHFAPRASMTAFNAYRFDTVWRSCLHACMQARGMRFSC